MKIETKSLMKAFSYKTSLVFRDRSIRIHFDVKNPFATDHILGGSRWNKLLGIISKKGRNVIRHSLPPFNMFNSFGNTGGFNRVREWTSCASLVETFWL